MTRSQFAILLTLCAAMSLAGSFGAVYLLQGESINAQAKNPELLRARRFELVDEKGKVRASLGLDKKGNAKLMLRDQDGKARIELLVEEGGAGLKIRGADEKKRIELGTVAKEGRDVSTLSYCDPNGKTRFTINHTSATDPEMAARDSTYVMFFDRKETSRCILGINGRDVGALGFLDADKNQRIRLMTGEKRLGTALVLSDPENDGQCTFFTDKGRSYMDLISRNSRVVASAYADGSSSLDLLSGEDSRLSAAVSKAGVGTLRTLDAKGKHTWASGKTKDGK